MKNISFMDNIKHFIEFTSSSLHKGQDEEIRKLMVELNEIKESTKLHFCANGLLDVEKTIKKQRKKEKKLRKQEKKAKKLSSQISKFPNYIELTSDLLSSTLGTLDSESIQFYNPKDELKFQALWLSVTDNEQSEGNIFNNDLFVRFIKQQYEVVETTISNDSEFALAEDEKVVESLHNFNWTTSSSFSNNTKYIYVDDKVHLLLRKKEIVQRSNAPTLSPELRWKHKEVLDLDLPSALAKRTLSQNPSDCVYPTLIFIDREDVDFFMKISSKDDIYNVDIIRKLVQERDLKDFRLNELDSRFSNVSEQIFVIYDRKQGLLVQEKLSKLSEINSLVHVIFIDREGKSSKSVLNMINESIATNFHFHFVSNKMRALPVGIANSKRKSTLVCAGIDSLLGLRKSDRGMLSHISIYRSGDEELKYIPQEKLDEFGNYHQQSISSTMIVATDWDDFMKKGKLSLGLAGRTK